MHASFSMQHLYTYPFIVCLLLRLLGVLSEGSPGEEAEEVLPSVSVAWLQLSEPSVSSLPSPRSSFLTYQVHSLHIFLPCMVSTGVVCERKGLTKASSFSIVANWRGVSVSSLCGQRIYQKPTSIEEQDGRPHELVEQIKHPLETKLCWRFI